MANAAIYARKSTDQTVADQEKSVTRQVELAVACARTHGFEVPPEHIYVDDAISGAEFDRRPGLMRLLNTLRPQAPFAGLFLADKDRLGLVPVAITPVRHQASARSSSTRSTRARSSGGARKSATPGGAGKEAIGRRMNGSSPAPNISASSATTCGRRRTRHFTVGGRPMASGAAPLARLDPLTRSICSPGMGSVASAAARSCRPGLAASQPTGAGTTTVEARPCVRT